ncbi:MAG: hypothetical protein DRQ51_07875 [Gammaproteobacteria bacterium]|nr:MAG: hypothetical protein DRQ51_07875 [Gammaproteobacteria bacterium]
MTFKKNNLIKITVVFLIMFLVSSCGDDAEYNKQNTTSDSNPTPPTTNILPPDISTSANIINATFDSVISAWNPINTSDPADSFVINPAISCNLNFNISDGNIQGTPNCAGDLFYEIKATNTGRIKHQNCCHKNRQINQ